MAVEEPLGGHHLEQSYRAKKESAKKRKRVNLTKRIKCSLYSHEKFNGNKIRASANVVENPLPNAGEI